jgi:hypothetical protein
VQAKAGSFLHGYPISSEKGQIDMDGEKSLHFVIIYALKAERSRNTVVSEALVQKAHTVYPFQAVTELT